MSPEWKAALRTGLLVSLVLILVLVVLHVAEGTERRRGPCATVRPESSRHACLYDHGVYGHAPDRQTYPRHVRHLAKAAYSRWARHHPHKATLSTTAWWASVTAHDTCIAYYAARSKCPADGITKNKEWMNKTVEVILGCGGSTLLFLWATPAGALAARAVVGNATGCFWGIALSWHVWD